MSVIVAYLVVIEGMGGGVRNPHAAPTPTDSRSRCSLQPTGRHMLLFRPRGRRRPCIVEALPISPVLLLVVLELIN